MKGGVCGGCGHLVSSDRGDTEYVRCGLRGLGVGVGIILRDQFSQVSQAGYFVTQNIKAIM